MGVEDEEDPAPPAGEKKAPGSEPEPQLIPKPRFDQVNTRLREANERIAELEGKLASASGSKDKPAKDDPEPKPREAPAQAKPVELDARIIQLRLDHQLSQEAAEAVRRYEQQGLSAEDAMAFAQMRKPGLFGEDRRGFDETTHSSERPGTGKSDPPKDPEPTQLQKVAAISDLNRRGKAALAGARELVKNQMFRRSSK